MKRSLAIALAVTLAASLAPIASAAQPSAVLSVGPSAADAPVSSSDRDNRGARTCGDFCVDRVYSNVELGAWFIDGENELLLAGRSTLKVVNTLTQKSTTVFTSSAGTEIDKIVLSENRGYALAAADTHGLEAITDLSALHLMHKAGHDAHARRANWMA